MLTSIIINGLLLGLSTGSYCLAACAPAILPYIVSCGWKSSKVSLLIVGEFLAGRITAYILLGSLVVLFGTKVQSSQFGQKAVAVLIVMLAALLISHGLMMSFPEWRICAFVKRSSVLRRFPFAAGFILGLNVCPPIMLAFTYLLTVERWLSGAFFFVAFIVGTAIFLIPLFLSGYLGRLPSLRGIGEVAAIFSGLWFFTHGVLLWMRP